MFDVTWREEKGKLLLFPGTPAAAQWVAKYITTNVHDTIHFGDIPYAKQLLTNMQADGLLVGTQAEADAQAAAQLEAGEYDDPQDECPRCGESENIANEDGPTDGRLPVTCHNCGYQWTEPDVD